MSLEPISISGRYRVLKKLGEGLTGQVYLVESSDGPSALKLLKPFTDRRLEESILQAFQFEFGFLKDLSHPHVVKIQDFGFDPELKRFFFTEEFLDGRPLDEFAQGANPSLLEQLFLQSVRGLQAIHRARVLHGDLKGSNLLVVSETLGPVVKIIDLGLSDPRFPFTAGTPATMAPEKILKDPADERSDLYSLGVLFYELFSGFKPFARKTVKETYQAHLSYRPPPVTLKNPKVPVFWNEIFETLMSKNPAHRYRDAEELLEAVELAHPEKRGEARKLKSWKPDRWILRGRILDEVYARIRRALHEKERRSVFFLSGERGVGKSRLLQEVKYRLQMEKVQVFESKRPGDLLPPKTFDASGLWLLDLWEDLGEEERQKVIAHLGEKSAPRGVVLSLSPEDLPALTEDFKKALPDLQSVSLSIPPFSQEDLREFLQETMDTKELPPAFLNALWEKTGGSPRLASSLLEQLARDRGLVDARGRWNLALFEEGLFDWGTLPLDLPQIDEALKTLPESDLQGRAELWLKKAEELFKRNMNEEAEASLRRAKDAGRGLLDLGLRLHFHSRVYEKEGWRLIRQGRLSEARGRFERALALLEESGIEDAVLSIRLQNFIAWILSQEGRLDESLSLFAEQEARWEKLSPEDQAKVLNNERGAVLLQKGRAEEAVPSLKKYLEFYERVQNPSSQIRALYHLAEAESQCGNHPEAVKSYLKAAELSRLHRNFEMLLRSYNGLGKTFHLTGEVNEGLQYYERALNLARYLEDFLSAAAVAQNIGSVQSERGEYDAAEERFELSLKMLNRLQEKSAHARYLQCRALLERGDLERKRKRYAEAEAFLRDAKNMAHEEPSLKAFQFWVLYAQAQLELERGDWERLQDLAAQLLPLADDEEKKMKIQDLIKNLNSTSDRPAAEEGNTRVESRGGQAPLAGGYQALIRVAKAFASQKDPERLLELILSEAAELSGAEAGVVLLEEGKGLKPKASVNLNLNDSLIQMSERVAEEALRLGRSLPVDDALGDSRFNAYESVIEQSLRSILALPIRSPDGISGVLALIHRHRSGAFAEISLPLMEALADQAGLALSNARRLKELEEARKALAGNLAQVQDELDQTRIQSSDAALFNRFAERKLVSRNPKMAEVFRLVERLADTDLSVLLHGESGTGKELVAKFLHQHSRRGKGPFVAVNCAALPANLIESELFGFKAGAFTGATRDKKGLIEAAQGGTFFLDEIAELELPLQAKLLRVLEEREITRLGETKPLAVDFRLVAASHRRLKNEAAQGRFREDLFYRVCETELSLPPLRERKEDIPLLTQALIDRALKERKEKEKVTPGRDLLKLFLEYSWPGNVRELENAVRVATALRRGPVLKVSDLPEGLKEQLGQRASIPPSPGTEAPRPKTERPSRGSEISPSPEEGKTWKDIETLVMAKALIRFGFDVKKASEALSCAPSTLYQRMREHRIEERREEFAAASSPYEPLASLDEIKKQVIEEAVQRLEGSPYQAARALGISPGMVYKWIGGR